VKKIRPFYNTLLVQFTTLSSCYENRKKGTGKKLLKVDKSFDKGKEKIEHEEILKEDSRCRE